jgi:hypothetical protein
MAAVAPVPFMVLAVGLLPTQRRVRERGCSPKGSEIATCERARRWRDRVGELIWPTQRVDLRWDPSRGAALGGQCATLVLPAGDILDMLGGRRVRPTEAISPILRRPSSP